jgi:tight adherence protein B
VSAALLCLAGALAVWPVAGARARLARLSAGPRLLAPSVRLLAARAGPVPAGAAAALAAALVSTPLVAVLAGACTALAARAWSAGRRRARERAELAALAEGLGAFGAELRAGRSLEEAVDAAAAACGREAAARLVRAVRAPQSGDPGRGGGALPAALGRISAAVLLSGRTGCSLAEVVAAVEDDLRARLRAERELRSATAAPRAGAALLAGLPVLGLAMGAGVGADPWGVLTTTAAGQVLLVAGVGLEAAGVVWSGRLVERAAR